MAGHDKFLVMEELIAKGWREATDEEQRKEWGSYQVMIPDSLLEELKGRVLYVIYAEDLQTLMETARGDYL